MQLRVLVVAMHASTQFGGEAILPLHWFCGIRRQGIEAWLIVHERTRHELRNILGSDFMRVVFIKDRWIHKLLWKIGRFLPARVRSFSTGLLIHSLTQFEQRRLTRQLIRQKEINIVHEPIPVSPRLPSMMYNVGAPVIIGPLNGGMMYPNGFRKLETQFEYWFTAAGRQFANIGNLIIPGKRKAAFVIVANDRTRNALPSGCKSEIKNFCENGVDLKLWKKVKKHHNRKLSDVTRFVYLGRLVDLKCVDLLIEAFHGVIVSGIKAELWIIGDGPERLRIESLIQEYNLKDVVKLHGWLPHARCPDMLRFCDVLVLPSVHECGGAVVLEAMAAGLSVIATNWGGPADYIDEK